MIYNLRLMSYREDLSRLIHERIPGIKPEADSHKSLIGAIQGAAIALDIIVDPDQYARMVEDFLKRLQGLIPIQEATRETILEKRKGLLPDMLNNLDTLTKGDFNDVYSAIVVWNPEGSSRIGRDSLFTVADRNPVYTPMPHTISLVRTDGGIIAERWVSVTECNLATADIGSTTLNFGVESGLPGHHDIHPRANIVMSQTFQRQTSGTPKPTFTGNAR